MPFKANAARRHHIPKQRHRVTNWAEYDAALRQRGSLTVWFTEEAIAAWRAEPRKTPRRPAALLGSGDQDGVDATGGVPAGATPNGRSDRLDPAAPGPGSGRAGSLNPEPPGRNTGGPKAMSTLRRACSPTGRQHRAAAYADPASGWSKSTALADVDPGASCTSVLTLRPDRSSHQS